MYEIRKDPFIRRYRSFNPPVSSFEADINRYTLTNNSVKLISDVSRASAKLWCTTSCDDTIFFGDGHSCKLVLQLNTSTVLWSTRG